MLAPNHVLYFMCCVTFALAFMLFLHEKHEKHIKLLANPLLKLTDEEIEKLTLKEIQKLFRINNMGNASIYPNRATQLLIAQRDKLQKQIEELYN